MNVLEHIELRDTDTVREAILETYYTQGFVIVSFLYFANMMKGRLLEGTPEPRQHNYLEALRQSDFLLADGIALQLRYRRSAIGRKNKMTPPNLNGTDFIPYFFSTVLAQYPQAHVSLLMFRDEKIGKGEEYAQVADEVFTRTYGRPFGYIWQTHYATRASVEFDWEAYEHTLSDDDQIRILFVCLGTPTQELWTHKYADMIKKHRCLVLNAGGTIDYMTGLEQRAPQRVVKARVLETLRRITTHPQKNLKKFLSMFGVVRYRWYQVSMRWKLGKKTS